VILGDVHGRFTLIDQIYQIEKPDHVLQCGDLAEQERGERRFNVGAYPERLPKDFHWIYGNHERLDVEPPGDCLGFFGKRNIEGLRIVGIGGIDGKKRPVHWGANGAIEKATQIDYWPDILISHETCQPFPHSKRGYEMGSTKLTEACKKLKPKMHLSGHHHHYEEKILHNVKHVRLPLIWQGYYILENGEGYFKRWKV